MKPPAPEVSIEIMRLDHAGDLELPSYATAGSAGVDLRAAVDSELAIAAGARALVPTGIAIALPPGYEAQVRPRSGLAIKHGITLLNAPGTIDSDYRGEIKAILANLGEADFIVRRGERIAQLVIAPVTRVAWTLAESLPQSGRAGGGFGSTGTGAPARAKSEAAGR
ncbi:MAG: dUTP diphosphatase [Alphaproteobacteria bacterium]